MQMSNSASTPTVAPVSTRPTIKHIAEMCGVSVATVSYVINGKQTLKPATRERVLRAMQEVNYHPNAVARGLQSQRVHTLGILFGSVSPVDFADHTYVTGLLRGVMKCAREEGFDITFFTAGWKNAAVSAPALCDGRTDGVLAMAPRLNSDMIEGLAAHNIVHVAISAGDVAAPNVDIDNQGGIEMAMSHLIELGHRRIAFFNGHDNMAAYQPRRAGYLAALKSASLKQRADWMLDFNFDGLETYEPARAFLRNARANDDLPTAICAANDYIALATMKAAQSLEIAGAGRTLHHRLRRHRTRARSHARADNAAPAARTDRANCDATAHRTRAR